MVETENAIHQMILVKYLTTYVVNYQINRKKYDEFLHDFFQR